MNAPEDQNGLREALARAEAERDAAEAKAKLRALALLVAEEHFEQAASDAAGWHSEYKNERREKNDAEGRARAAEAEITRLKEGMEALKAKAEEQVAYWRERQAAEKGLEDGVSEDGETYTPMGDHAAWQGGYCNGRMSEADWWRWTIRALIPAPPTTPGGRTDG